MKQAIALWMLALCTTTHSADIRCLTNTTTCIKTQGTSIPSKKVIEMLELCEDFTTNGAGSRVLRMSQKQILDYGNGRITILDKANYAFDKLYESPLKFERKRKAEDTNYGEIVQSCRQLESDFNNDAKWVR